MSSPISRYMSGMNINRHQTPNNRTLGLADRVLSTVEVDQLDNLVDQFGIPGDLRARLPAVGETVANPLGGWTAVYVDHIRQGLRFPLSKCWRRLLAFYHVNFWQLTPDAIRYVSLFMVRCRLADVPFSLSLLHRSTTYHFGGENDDWLNFLGPFNGCAETDDFFGIWQTQFFMVKDFAVPRLYENGPWIDNLIVFTNEVERENESLSNIMLPMGVHISCELLDLCKFETIMRGNSQRNLSEGDVELILHHLQEWMY